jgi:benzoyl-CoA reductase/2-hydroxyglutaryl-CoA dehydratase subunit BcrC/BadD/HgdB
MTQSNLVQNVAETFEKISSHVAAKRPQDRWIYEVRTKYYQQVFQAKKEGRPLAWQSFGAIPELFYAMDIIPMSPEALFAVLTAFPEGVTKYLDIAHRFVPPHICSANKAPLGAIIAGDLPTPNLIVHASQPCDSGLISFPTLADYLGIPHFCLDVPYWADERTLDYLVEELERLITFLEETTGRRLEEDSLRRVMEHSNQAHYYLLKANELRKSIPCPLPSRLLLLNSGAFISMAGMPELVDYARAQYELAKSRVEKGEGHLSPEKKRLAFIYTGVFCDPGLYDWVEQDHSAVIAMDMMGNYVHQPVEDLSTREAMLRGLARKLLSLPMARESRGPRHYWYDATVEMCREYKVDGAIFAGNIACKHGWAIVKLVKDIIYDRVKIPTLIFDVDLMDPRVSPPQSVRARISEFFSLL